MKTKLALAAILTASLLFTAHAQEPKTEVKMTEIPYITLSAELFEKWLLWWDGKYITIDHKGRFATVDMEKNLRERHTDSNAYL